MSWTSASVGDVIAGMTVAATSLPQYIAYAGLAGMPGHLGVKVAAPPLVAFSVITGSPSLCIGVTSITALMAFSSLNGSEYIEKHGEASWIDLLATYSVMVGIASTLLAVTGAAEIFKHIPGPVKAGWKLGLALVVVTSQAAGAVFGGGAKDVKALTKDLPSGPDGLPISGGTAAMYRLVWMLTNPWTWNYFTVGLSLLTLGLVWYGTALLKKVLGGRKPMPGLEVIIATVLGALVASAFAYSGDIVGAPASTGSSFEFNAKSVLLSWIHLLPWEMPYAAVVAQIGGWPQALFSCIAFAGVDFLAIVSVEAQAPPANGWSATKEMLGQGIGCVVSGMAGGAPVGGSLSRSMVAQMTGAGSPLMGLVCGITSAALALPAVAVYFAPVPKATLSAIVLAAVLPSVVNPKDVLKLKGTDALIAWVTAMVSTFADPMVGFMAGSVLYAVFHLRIERYHCPIAGGQKVRTSALPDHHYFHVTCVS